MKQNTYNFNNEVARRIDTLSEDLCAAQRAFLIAKEEARCFKVALEAFAEFDCETTANIMNDYNLHFHDSCEGKVADIIGNAEHLNTGYTAKEVREMVLHCIKVAISRWMSAYDPAEEFNDSMGCECVNGGIFCAVEDGGFTIRFSPVDVWVSNDDTEFEDEYETDE